MQGFVFPFTLDASGSADAITLPEDFPRGCRSIVLRPPAGHAWTFYGAGSSGLPLAMDEPLPLPRSTDQAPFKPGEVIGSAALDTGSGTGYGVAS